MHGRLVAAVVFEGVFATVSEEFFILALDKREDDGILNCRKIIWKNRLVERSEKIWNSCLDIVDPIQHLMAESH